MSLPAIGIMVVVGLARSMLESNHLTIKIKKYYIVVLCQPALISYEPNSRMIDVVSVSQLEFYIEGS